MSDLPNFLNRPWYKKAKAFRLVFIALGILCGALVWVMAEEFPEELNVNIDYTMGTKALIGQEFQYSIVIRNNEEKTVEVKVEAAFYAQSGACVSPGSPIKNSFSLPQTILVSPNSSKILPTAFTVSETCEAKALSKIFVTAKKDGALSTKTFIGPTIDIL